jgi:hypothetical protein
MGEIYPTSRRASPVASLEGTGTTGCAGRRRCTGTSRGCATLRRCTGTSRRASPVASMEVRALRAGLRPSLRWRYGRFAPGFARRFDGGTGASRRASPVASMEVRTLRTRLRLGAPTEVRCAPGPPGLSPICQSAVPRYLGRARRSRAKCRTSIEATGEARREEPVHRRSVAQPREVPVPPSKRRAKPGAKSPYIGGAWRSHAKRPHGEVESSRGEMTYGSAGRDLPNDSIDGG